MGRSDVRPIAAIESAPRAANFVRVLVDSYQFAVAPSRKLADVDIQHFGWGISVSEFGLSMHAETRRGTETRSGLMDFGFTPEALLNNVDLVGIDPARLDALVLSHGRLLLSGSRRGRRNDRSDREVMPGLRRLVIMANAGYAAPVLEVERAKATAQALGLEARLKIWVSEDIAPAFEAIRGETDALYVVSDALIAANRTLIITLALSARLSTILSYGDYVEAGGLMSFGPNYANLFRQAADMVNKILRGTKPGDIPVEQPSQFELVINLNTAKALGITVPASLLANADKVIQ